MSVRGERAGWLVGWLVGQLCRQQPAEVVVCGVVWGWRVVGSGRRGLVVW